MLSGFLAICWKRNTNPIVCTIVLAHLFREASKPRESKHVAQVAPTTQSPNHKYLTLHISTPIQQNDVQQMLVNCYFFNLLFLDPRLGDPLGTR